MDNVGNVFSSNSISNFLKNEKISVSPVTIGNYLKYIEKTSLFNRVPREDIKGNEILKTNEKYYVVDTGFMQAIRGINRYWNRGRVIENIVYLELVKRGYNVSIGKLNGFEIDFLCKGNDDVFYVQVAERIHEGNIGREFSSLLKLKDNYPKYVVSENLDDKSMHGVRHMNLLDFLIEF